jgi:hypothetical protein
MQEPLWSELHSGASSLRSCRLSPVFLQCPHRCASLLLAAAAEKMSVFHPWPLQRETTFCLPLNHGPRITNCSRLDDPRTEVRFIGLSNEPNPMIIQWAFSNPSVTVSLSIYIHIYICIIYLYIQYLSMYLYLYLSIYIYNTQ